MWRDIQYLSNYKEIELKIAKLFSPFFKLKKTFFDDVGHYVFKFILIAVNVGILCQTKEIGFDIQIREKNNYVTNEVKKNNLLYEKINTLQLHVDDTLIFYMTIRK
jgi:hypothetical protein